MAQEIRKERITKKEFYAQGDFPIRVYSGNSHGAALGVTISIIRLV